MMTPEGALAAQIDLFNDALEVVKAKRIDYSGRADPFTNFRQSQFWGVEPWRGAAIRLMDKLSRFNQLAMRDGNGEVKDESIRDTVIDLINYAAIVYLLWLEQSGKNAPIPTLLMEEKR